MDNAFRTCGVGGGEDVSARGVARLGERVMHVVRRMQSEPAVVMLGVVPSEEIDAVRAGDLKAASRLVLAYYDRCYRESLEKVPSGRMRHFSFDHLDPAIIAEALCASA